MTKNILYRCAILFAMYSPLYAQTIQEPCISNTVLQENILNNPELLDEINQLEAETEIYTLEHPSGINQKSAVKIIPVVFHIIHQYGAENITRAQCLDQIRVLNQDYRRLNTDTNNTPVAFRPVAADCNIEFRIAQKDPNGNCTDGVNRVYSAMTVGARDNVKSLISWPRNKYLNIWVVKYITGSASTTGYVVGFAQFPGGGQASTDGIVVRYDFLGNIGPAAGERGRTATHEVGHWLNLRHIWGDATCGNDNVSDTPTQQDANQSNCPTFPHVTCNNGPNGDMYTNYMDYTSASCQNIFTVGQSTRMNAALNSNSGSRNNLWTGTNLTATGALDTGVVLCSPKADFTPHIPVYVCAGGTVSMTDKSWRGAATSRMWYFTGGTPSTSSDLNPVITYSTPGVYNISLRVTNASGQDSITKNGVVIVMPTTAMYQNPYFEGFENQTIFNTDWTVLNYEPTSSGFIRSSSAAATGLYSCKLSVLSNTLENDIDELISPSIDLSQYTTPKLHFKHAYVQTTTAAAGDNRLTIFISANCGKTWTQLFFYAASSLSTGTATDNEFVPTSAEWAEKIISAQLISYATQTNVRFKFKFTGASSGNNLYLDDIFIEGGTPASTEGINDVSNSVVDFKVLPNPTNSSANLSFFLNEQSIVSVQVFDALGNIVMQKNYGKINMGSQNINLISSSEALNRGIYFVRIKTNNSQETCKLVVQ